MYDQGAEVSTFWSYICKYTHVDTLHICRVLFCRALLQKSPTKKTYIHICSVSAEVQRSAKVCINLQSTRTHEYELIFSRVTHLYVTHSYVCVRVDWKFIFIHMCVLRCINLQPTCTHTCGFFSCVTHLYTTHSCVWVCVCGLKICFHIYVYVYMYMILVARNNK